MNYHKQERIGAIISYITLAFYIIAGLLYTPFLIRTLGMSDYGLFSLSASLIAYFTIDFGIGAAQTRFIARYRAEGKEYKIKDLIGLTAKIYIVIDVILLFILSIVYTFSEEIFTNFTPEELKKFQTVFLISSFFVLFNVPLLPVNGIYIAYEKIIVLKLFDLSSKVITVSFLVIALLLGYGLYGVVLVSACTTLAIQCSKLIYLYKKLNLKINIKARDKETLKALGSFSLWATVAMIADKFFFSIIPLLLAIFSTTRQIAIFAVVISIEGYVLLMARSLSGIFLPKVMSMVVQNKTPEQITNLMIKVGRIQLYILGLFIIGLISLGKEFIHHWLGDGFSNSYYGLVIVLLPCLFHLTQTIAEELVYAYSKVKYIAFTYIIGSSLSVITIVLLTPKLGAIGAAIGVFLSFVIAHNIIIDIIYHKVFKINMIRFLSECHLKILPALLIALVFGLFMQKFIFTNTFLTFGIKGVVWVIFYFLMLWILAFNPEEKSLIKHTIKIAGK